MRAADYVFETLSRAILSGELVPGSVLATQRELSTQFGVSPLVVRQATHRLEELGLVRVRQGSVTTVLDPNEASDVRLMQLRLELATPGDRLALAARESQALSTLPILALAERRITEAELAELDQLIDNLPDAQVNPHETLTFRVQFWGRIARATRNPLVEQQVRWWASVMQTMEARNGGDPTGVYRTLPKPIYRGLIRAMRRRRGSPEFWLKVIQPLFDWSEAQPTHAMHAQSGKAPAALKQARAR